MATIDFSVTISSAPPQPPSEAPAPGTITGTTLIPKYLGLSNTTLSQEHNRLLSKTSSEYLSKSYTPVATLLSGVAGVSITTGLVTFGSGFSGIVQLCDFDGYKVSLSSGANVFFADCKSDERFLVDPQGRAWFWRCYIDGKGENQFSGSGLILRQPSANDQTGYLGIWECFITRSGSDACKGADEFLHNVVDLPLVDSPTSHPDMFTATRGSEIVGNVFIGDPAYGIVHQSEGNSPNAMVFINSGDTVTKGNLYLVDPSNVFDGSTVKYANASPGSCLMVGDVLTKNSNGNYTQDDKFISVQSLTDFNTGSPISASQLRPNNSNAVDVTGNVEPTPSIFAQRPAFVFDTATT